MTNKDIRTLIVAAAGLTVTAAAANIFLVAVLYLANLTGNSPGAIILVAVIITVVAVVAWLILAGMEDREYFHRP